MNKDSFSLKEAMSQRLEKLYSEKNFSKKHRKIQSVQSVEIPKTLYICGIKELFY